MIWVPQGMRSSTKITWQPQALLDCRENTVLQPHAGATAVTWEMTQGIVDDVRRFQAGQPLQLRVSLAQYRLMTQE